MLQKILLIFLLAFALPLMGGGVGDNTFKIGEESGQDIDIQMGGGRFKWNDSTSKLQFSNDSGVSSRDIEAGGEGAAVINILENPDFEIGSPPTSWTASGGTYIAETSTPGFNNQSGSWDSNGTSQTLDSDFETVPLGLEARPCNAVIQYKYDSGSLGDYKLQAIGNSAGLLVEKDLDTTTDWASDQIFFTCPSTDSIKIRIISDVANPGIILVDNAVLGKTDLTNSLDIKVESYDDTATYSTCAVRLNYSGSAPIVSAHTACITSVDEDATGTIGVNFSITFGAAPYCVCATRTNGGLTDCATQNENTTGVDVLTRTEGVFADVASTLFCIGKK